MAKKAYKQLIFAIFFLVLLFQAFPAYPDIKKEPSVFDRAKELMKEGKYRQTRQILKSYAPKKNEEKLLKSYLTVIDYQEPDWYPGDFSELKKYKNHSFPLMLELAGSPLPRKTTPDQRKWIIITRCKFIEAISKMGYREASPVILKLLKDEDPGIRIAAIEAIVRLKPKNASVTLFQYLKTERIPQLSSKDDVALLAKLEELARGKAIEAIVRIDDDSIIPELQREIEDSGSPDREVAGIILTGMHRTDQKNTYVRMLKDNLESLRVYAAAALKDMGDNQGISVLRDIFRNADDKRKLWVFRVMTLWRNSETSEFFIKFLKNTSLHANFGYVAVSTLGKAPPVFRIAEPRLQLVLEMMQSLIQWKEITPPQLIRILKTETGNIKYIAVEILGETTSSEGIPIFRKNLASGDSFMKYYCIWALGRLRDKNSMREIKKFLSGKDEYLQSAACWSLSRMNDNSGFGIALKLLDKKDPVLVSAAIDALYYLRKKESSKALMEVFQNGSLSQELQRNILITLGILESEESLEFLRERTGDAGSNSYYAAEAVYRITGKPVTFKSSYFFPGDSSLYGHGTYSDMDYARVILLYMFQNSEEFGKITDVTIAYAKKVKIFDEFGKILESSEPNPVREKPDLSLPVAWTLYDNQPVIIKEYSGRMVKILSLDGKTGWCLLAGLNIIENAIESSRIRFQNDYGCRWKADLLEIIKRDYLRQSNIRVVYSKPEKAINAAMIEMWVSLFLDLCRQRSSDLYLKDLYKQIDDGKKTISVSLKFPAKKFEFIFNSSGELEKISVIRENPF